jgi:signal transduction histidine kinase
MTGLMQELLDFGRPVPVAMAPGMVAETVREAVEVCEPLAERQGVRFELRLDAAGGHGMMDRARLVQVFKNVIENAVQHSPAGGAVQVDGRETADEHGAPWFECLIADSGPGFRPEDLPRIFDPFFTRRRGGTGLGLSIVQRVAEEHGGTVAASNRPGGGAAVTVRLPLLAGSAPSGDAARGG